MGFRTAVAAALLLASVVPAVAQQPVALQFNGGRVTLRAQNVPIRTILAEWARLGGATVVNGERVAGPPVTLELTDVPERQALDVILRSVAGYMLAPRRAGSVGPSAFDRIMILPTSVAPRNPPLAAAAAAGPRPVLPRPPVIARPPDAALDVPADLQLEDDPAEVEPVVTPPAIPGIGSRVVPPTVVRPLPGAEPTPDEPDTDSPGTPTAAPTAPPTPSNPFGVPVGSSTTPGVISPVPRPQPQQGQTNRVQ
ncbi:MAG: hypothetical protein ACRD3C_08860 [Vicinamibacterales bacterium]